MRAFLLLLILTLPLKAAEIIFDAFESDGFGEWKLEGKAFGKAPVAASPKSLNGTVQDYSNDYYVTSAHGGDREKGSLTSPEFIITKPYITFLISGGPHKGETAVQLLINEKVVRESNGRSDLKMRSALWPVTEFKGKKAQIRLLDTATGIWGIINADHFLFSDSPNPKFPLTTTEGTPHEKGLVAAKQIPGLTVPEGSHVRLFSDFETHSLYSPTAITVDEKNRVYAVETHRFRDGVEDNRDHLYWLLDDLASEKVEDRRALHEKWKHRTSIEKLTSKEEVIRVLEDTNGDAKADRTEVFANGFNDVLDGTAAGIMALEGQIYFACIPNIWKLEDQDGDLISDNQTVLQDGFGVRVSFSGHDLNGFAQGPDGRIYCTIGDRGFHFTTKEGITYRYPDQGAILRFDPDGSNFQVVHTGLRNPKEIAFDKYGTAITVDNNSDQGDRARVVFMMEGADSGWRMGHQVLHTFHKTVGLTERPINAWMAEKMWLPQNESQPAFIVPPIANLTSGPSGLAYYPGTGYDMKVKDQFAICDYRGSAAASGIWHFDIQPKGGGFELGQFGKLNWNIAATDLEWGYDGRLYVSDFIQGWVAHPAGRIYSLGYSGITKDPKVVSTRELIQKDFATMESEALAELLGHHDQRIRLRAQLHLAKKPNALPYFTRSANQRLNEVERLHGLWGLGIMARRDQNKIAMDFLANLLEDKNPRIRAQAAKALGDTHLPSSLVLLPLLLDTDDRVRTLTCLALAKHPHPEVYDQLIPLIEENADRDPYLRYAAALCLAANVQQDYLATLRTHPSAPVRMAAVIALRRFQSRHLAQYLTDPEPKIISEAIRAIHDLSIETARPALAALLDDLSNLGKHTPMTLRRLIHSSFRLGGEQNITRLVKIAASSKIPTAERHEAIRLLSLWTVPPKVDQSIGDYAPLQKREETKFKATLLKEIHHLFETDTLILGKSLALASQYQIAKDTLDTGTLTRLVRDKESDAFTRSEALKLLMQTSPEEPSRILAEAAQSSQDLLANTALELSAKYDPAANIEAIKHSLTVRSTTRRQTAWNIVATLPSEHAVPLIRDELARLQHSRGDHEAMLEILAAARSREEPSIKAALASYEKSLSPNDPLAKWQPALAGGDAVNGKKLFQSHSAAQCMRCHRAKKGHAEGGDAGPNLLGVALRHDARGLLESLIQPSAKLAPRFGMGTATLKGGHQKTGLILDETETQLDLKEGDTVWQIQKSDLASPLAQKSSMPSMEGALKISEARDIIAWLLTLTKESGETPAAYEAVKLDLAQLPETKPQNKAMPENVIDPAVMELGKQNFMLCAACHGQNGEGTPAAPPLAESEWVNGPAENLIRIQLRGLQGPIDVKGQTYDLMMPPAAHQSDEQISSVLTYIRNSFGNSASAVTPDMVKGYRGEAGQAMLTVADLQDPFTAAEVGPLPPLPEISAKATVGASTWGAAAFLIIGGLTLLGLARMKFSS